MDKLIEMEAVHDALVCLPGLQEWSGFWQIWSQATERPRRDWLLPVVSAEACGALADDVEQLVDVVAAVGCAQISIILIDDLLDEEPHGAQHKFGVGRVANMAAGFQSAAMQLAGNQASKWAMEKMFLDTAVGQAIDVQGIEDEASYWQLVQAKSTPFYGASLSLGGAVMEASDVVVGKLYQLGKMVGEMVQVRDDLLDVMASPAAPDWGRPLSNLLLLYGSQGKYAAEFGELLVDVRSNREGALARAQTHLVEVGAVAYCEEVVRVKLQKALRFIEGIGLEAEPLVMLLERQRLQFDDIEA